jgi:hypothetical protein
MSLHDYVDHFRVDRGYWFAPKMFGFGATPVTWQGWLLAAGFVALIFADMRFVRSDAVRITLIVVLLVAFCLIAAMKTEGGWRWRWGPER